MVDDDVRNLLILCDRATSPHGKLMANTCVSHRIRCLMFGCNRICWLSKAALDSKNVNSDFNVLISSCAKLHADSKVNKIRRE
ncbi:hypothetical protein X777_03784 [Ooceraea biroi]|uniref:Uncharacterized protein n=1 Tax=Ooceraea biroi TaxID=2015173 RepID=A0A026WHM5_OOCBI|nr:hypothetical protein X777_03784 [Ooceraea biroi]